MYWDAKKMKKKIIEGSVKWCNNEINAMCVRGHHQTRLHEGGQGEKAVLCEQHEEEWQGVRDAVV